MTSRLGVQLAQRQAEAFSRSVLRLLRLGLTVLGQTTLISGGRTLAGHQPRMLASPGPIHLVLDNTRMELFGQGELDAEKRGRALRQWRELHFVVELAPGRSQRLR